MEVSEQVPKRMNERRSFVRDQIASGRCFRILNIVDDYTRECVAQIVNVSISGPRVARCPDELAGSRGLPRTIVCDNGQEYT